MRILLVGGAASGKSSLAEALAVSFAGPRAYIATMRPVGAEGRARVARHRALRAGKGFVTIECYRGLSSLDVAQAYAASEKECAQCAESSPAVRFSDRASALSDSPREDDEDFGTTVLLECVCNLVANELYDDAFNLKDAEEVYESVVGGLASISRQARHLVVVTNEVGADGVDYPSETQAYIAMIGRVNCALALAFDVVIEVVGGVPCVIKGPKTFVRDRVSQWEGAS